MRNKLFLLGMILIFLPGLVSAQNLTISPNGTFFNLSNILPGDSFWKEVNLTNSGEMLISKIIVSTDFKNNCTPIEPNGFCNWSGEGKPNLTDVLNCSLVYNGKSVVNTTITELKKGVVLDGLLVNQTKTLNITITFYPLAGNKYQATSAVVNFSFTTLPPGAVINEIMYNPDDNTQCKDDYCEWIELFNPTNESINLSGWKLCGDELLPGYVNHTGKSNPPVLKNTTLILEPNQYAIITDGGSGTEVYQYFSIPKETIALHVNASSLCGGLNNKGDTINLTDKFGNLVDLVSYKKSWGANGDGKTLERVNPWKPSIPMGGTPGGLNSIILWISNTSVNPLGTDLFNISANITHYYNLLKAEAWLVRESDNKTYIETLSTIDNQIYSCSWDTSSIKKGNYTIYIYAQDILGNSKLYNSGEKIEKSSPATLITTGRGHGVDLRKSYLVISPAGATMEQNETRDFEIEARNIGNKEIKNFEIFAKDSEVENWISITPDKENLGVGETKFWKMKIEVPADAESGVRYFTIYAKGDELSLSVNFTLTIAEKPEVFIRKEKPKVEENVTGEVPKDLKIVINNGEETTTSRKVILTLSAKNATECRLNNDGIEWSDWFNYTITKEWELTPAPGVKTVYFQCRNEFGESEIIYDKIEYVVQKTAIPTGYAILTNPTVLGLIIGGILLISVGVFFYKKKLKSNRLLT